MFTLKTLIKTKTFITILQHQQIKSYWHHKHNIKKESNNKLKEVSAKNHSCYYFNVIIEDFDIYVLIDKNHTKIYLFITIHAKL